jgi:hypothetical protein
MIKIVGLIVWLVLVGFIIGGCYSGCLFFLEVVRVIWFVFVIVAAVLGYFFTYTRRIEHYSLQLLYFYFHLSICILLCYISFLSLSNSSPYTFFILVTSQIYFSSFLNN